MPLEWKQSPRGSPALAPTLTPQGLPSLSSHPHPTSPSCSRIFPEDKAGHHHPSRTLQKLQAFHHEVHIPQDSSQDSSLPRTLPLMQAVPRDKDTKPSFHPQHPWNTCPFFSFWKIPFKTTLFLRLHPGAPWLALHSAYSPGSPLCWAQRGDILNRFYGAWGLAWQGPQKGRLRERGYRGLTSVLSFFNFLGIWKYNQNEFL